MEQNNTIENYAIFQHGGKQYQAIPGKTLALEKINAKDGEALEFKEVMLRKFNGVVEIGQPFVSSVIKVSVVKQVKDSKVIVFKFKRRKKSRVKAGHRQPKTVVRIEAI